MISKSILSSFLEIKDSFKIRVDLTYFKESGKYYTSGYYMEDYIPLFAIWDRVAEMRQHPNLSGKWDGLILVECKEHIHAHPHIINMGVE